MITIRHAATVLSTVALMWFEVSAQSSVKVTAAESVRQLTSVSAAKARDAQGERFTPLQYREGSNASAFVRSVDSDLSFYSSSENPLVDNSINFVASITSADGERTPGIYAMSTSGNFTLLGASADNNAKGGGVLVDEVYYTVAQTSLFGMTAIRGQNWDASTWSKISPYNWSLELKYVASDVAYDETTGKIFGCFYNAGGNAYEFGTADYVNKVRETICPLDYPLNAVAVDRTGQIYGIDILGDLYRIEKETGTMSKIGATGFVPKYVSSGAIDKKTGRMYWVVAPAGGGSFLCEVNLTTGRATKIYDFPGGEQITGLFFPDDKAHPDAPAAVTSLVADFQGGSLAGNVNFTMPATLFSGASISGDTSYRIYVNNKMQAEGSAGAGSDVAAPVTVPEAGNYKIEVVAVNAVGEGPTGRIRMFIGSDTPVTPAAVNVSYADGAFSVSWDPATESTNGGYIDPQKITYNLYRMPENKAVVEGGVATSYSDPVAEPEALTAYWYKMQILYDGVVCGESTSAHTTLGAIIPPYLQTFDNSDALDGYTIIDGNADKRKWYIYNGEAAVSFNDKTAKDDWLITPPVRMEAGKVYKFSIDVRANVDFYPETFNLMMGDQPTPEAMTTVLIPDSIVIKPGVTVSQFITAKADGLYYVGLHAITGAGPSMFYADNLTISEPIDGDTPAAVTDLVVTAQGYRSAMVSFSAPSLSATGVVLESIDKIEVSRDDVVVKTITNPKPGSAIEFTDNVETGGNYTYTVVSHNIFGGGTPATQTLYIGVPLPYRPGVATVTETAPGQVTLTWEPSTADEQGNPIPEEYIRYHVVELHGQEQVLVGNMVEGTTFTYTPMPDPQSQQFMQFAVFAVTEGGVSMGVVTELIPVGLAYTTPFVESFAGPAMSSIWGTSASSGEPEWNLYSDVSIQDVVSADLDNGFIGMRGTQGGEIGLLYSGKISLVGVDNPALSFQTFNITGMSDNGTPLPPDTNDVVVYVNDGSGWKAVLSSTVDALCNGRPGWSPVLVDLADYKGRNIQVGFMCSSKVFLFTLFDAIKVMTMHERNLTALSLTAPRYADAGREFTLQAVVENNGKQPSGVFDVVLIRNGVDTDRMECAGLEFGRNKIVEFADIFDGTSSENNTYSVRVDVTGDGYAADNVSAPAGVMMRALVNPMVRNLVASPAEGGVGVAWSAPDLSAAPPAEFNDSFEQYDSWANSHVGDWTFADLDKGKIGSLNYINLPGIPTGSQQAFWVMDDTLQDIADFTGGNWRYMARTGHKYLAQAFVAEKLQCDDWAISPRLYGGVQCVTLFAKSFMAGMPESFELYVSSAGNDVEDFELFEKCYNVPGDWTEYCFNLPAGTQYFAIRCMSQDRFMFFVDDVTYIPEGSPRSLQLKGYNVYRDGVLLNSDPVTECFYTDRDARGNVRYAVTALYDSGESKAVETTADLSGIDGVASDAPASIYSKTGKIHVDNAAGQCVIIASADGRVIFSARPQGNVSISTGTGVYIVKAGTKTVKIVVH